MKYLKGFLRNLFFLNVSKLAMIDQLTNVSRKARVTRFTKIVDSTIQDHSYIAPRTELLKADLGKFTSVGRDCYLGLPKHPKRFLSTSPIFYSSKNALKAKWTKKDYFEEFDRVNIGSDVWIGNRVTILGGISVGNGVIIGSGAVVTKDIPDYSVAVGVPAKVLRLRFSNDMCLRLSELKWWEFSDAKLKEIIELFQRDIETLEELNSIL